MVNNWANGWVIDNKSWNAEPVTYNNNNHVIRSTLYVILIFWPQYWQFLVFETLGLM